MDRKEAVHLSAATFSAEWVIAQVKNAKMYYMGMYFSHPVASYYEGQTLKFYITYDIKSERFNAIRSTDEVWLEKRS